MIQSVSLLLRPAVVLCCLFLSAVHAVDDTITVSGQAANVLAYDRSPAAYMCLRDYNAATTTLIVVLPDGLVERLRITSAGHFRLVAHGYLPDPTYALIGKIMIADEEHVAVFDRGGLQRIVWPKTLTDTASKLSCEPIIASIKQTLRVAQPRPYGFQRFISTTDLSESQVMLPLRERLAVFASTNKGVTWETKPSLPVAITHKATVPTATTGASAQPWISHVQIASPIIRDLNADGQLDIVTQHGDEWMFSMANGTQEPHVIRLDTSLFGEGKEMKTNLGILGEVPSRVIFDYGDVQGKKYCDLVVNHGTDLWLFTGTKDGPQLQQSVRYHWDQPIDAMFLCDLDGDQRQDLVTMRFEMPSLGRIVLGVLAPINIAIEVNGYRSLQSAFEQVPTWKQTITVRIPPLLTARKQFTQLSNEVELIEKQLVVASEPYDNHIAVFHPVLNEIRLYAALQSVGHEAQSGLGQLLNQHIFNVDNPVLDLNSIKKQFPELINDITMIHVNREKITSKNMLSTPKDRTVLDVMVISGATNEPLIGLVVGSSPTIPWSVEAVPLKQLDNSQ